VEVVTAGSGNVLVVFELLGLNLAKRVAAGNYIDEGKTKKKKKQRFHTNEIKESEDDEVMRIT
jgi:hypothetical protein